MKTILSLLPLIFVIGCKQDAKETGEPAGNPTPDPVHAAPSLLKTEGCTVLKTKGVLKVDCADGSSAEAGVPTYHIKSADGTDLDDLMFLQNWSQVGVLAINKRSGNILSYDNTGNVTKITRTLFTSNDCSGQAMAFFSDFIVRNKVMLNAGAAPAGVEALRVTGYVAATTSFNSRFENGVCSFWSGSAGGAATVEPTVFDDSDPIAIGLPIEIVFEQ